MIHKVLLVLTMCAIGAGRATALDPVRRPAQYGHDVWQTDQGLPQNSVTAIQQTRDGYLWLGTHQGLARFDGTRFVVFHSGNTPALTSNRIVALAEDAQGVLWIGTTGGGLVRYSAGQFTPFSGTAGPSSDSITALLAGREGSLWIGTRDSGLSRLKEGRVQNLTVADGLPAGVVTSLGEAADGALWIGTEHGLARYTNGTFRTYTTANGLPLDEVWSVYEDSRGVLWVGTHGGGLSRFENGRFNTFTTSDGLTDNSIVALMEDRDGNLWIGTNGGLMRHRDGVFDRFNTAVGLSDDSVYAIEEDREGNVWVGTSGGGLNRLKDVAMTTLSARDGLASDFLNAVLEDRGDTVWFGGVRGTLMRMSGDVVSAAMLPATVSEHDVWTLAEGPDGGVLIGTNGGGVVHFDGKRFIQPSWNAALSHQTIWAIVTSRDGTIWVGTGGGGVNRVRNGQVETLGTAAGLKNLFVRALYEDRQGRIWVGTDGGGLAVVENGRLTTTLSVAEGLSSNFVRCFYEDGQGVMWVGTYGGGLNRVAGGKVFAYTTRTGLFDDVVFQILEDGGYLWMSCNRGIFRVSRLELDEVAQGTRRMLTSIAYGRSDGMRGVECADGSPAGIRTASGRLLFATARGLVVIVPSHIPQNSIPPPIVIERVLVEGRPLTAGAQVDSQLGHGRFEFHYAGLSLVAPEKVRYRHRLTGYEEEWVDAGRAQVASYTNLPPGTYRFEVEARNNDGVWSANAAGFDFRRVPRFVETYSFYALCLGAIAMIATAGQLVRVQRSRRRERELMALVEDRTRQLESANLQLRRLSVIDPLTGVANRRGFDQHVALEWRRAVRAESPVAAIMVDLDAFKAFNDAYGHQEGDRCLQRVATVLTNAVQRAGDLVARFGGEEFVLLLQGTDEAGAAAIAERLRASVEAIGIKHEGSSVARVVTISLGVASVVPAAGVESADLIAAADTALYRAKAEGRNRVAVAPPSGILTGTENRGPE